MPLDYSFEGFVAVVRWDDGENRLSPGSVAAFERILDELDAVSGPLGIVVTGSGKYFCNGVDIDGPEADELAIDETVRGLQHLIGRLLVFPAHTVAAINGHAFGAGAVFSCAFDDRLMREGQGYWCVNEVEIGWPMDELLWSALAHRLSPMTAAAAAATAHRYRASEALAAGIVQAVEPSDSLVQRAVDQAARYASLDRTALGHVKRLAHGREALRLGFTD
jgi:enoyl-CoA hydratase/carnithine racemase